MEAGLSVVHKQPTWCLSGEDAHALCIVHLFGTEHKATKPNIRENNSEELSFFLAPVLTSHWTLHLFFLLHLGSNCTITF